MNKINLAIADDHRLIIEGLEKILGEFEDIGEIRSAVNGKELLNLLKLYTPHVILLDIEMPVMGGIEACKIISYTYPQIKIIGLTQHSEDAAICHMTGAGAHGYLLKDTDPDELQKAIKWVIEHDFYFNELTRNALLKSNRKEFSKNNFAPEVEITSREKQILKYICLEKDCKEIGELLCVSYRTVESARSKLMKKLDVKSVAGLVRFAVEKGYHLT